MSEPALDERIAEAATAVGQATAFLFTAGAGMGVDSGLPDFRGPEGFWAAYPPYRELGLRFEELANPSWFARDPRLAWGFYGHRLGLYRATAPHEGYAVLKRWAARAAQGAFVFTSNVDGHFLRAGFGDENIAECHGSLDWLQCAVGCGAPIFSSAPVRVDVDPVTFRAVGALPLCPACGSLARPNVLMFGDGEWQSERAEEQQARLRRFLASAAAAPEPRLVVVECGAGTSVPTVRMFGEALAARTATLIRLNLREPQTRPGGIGLPLPARAGLLEIDARLLAS